MQESVTRAPQERIRQGAPRGDKGYRAHGLMPNRKIRVEYVDPHELKHFPGNPRIMPDLQKEALHRSTERWGYVEPLVVRQGNEVVGGNQRLDEALASNQKEIPIIRIRINDAEAKALNLALNKIHGEWDEDKLAPLLVDLKDLPEINLTGFQIEEIENILSNSQIPDLSETGSDELETPGLSLVPYFGGKQALVPQLMAMIPPHISYVEVFGGGAALLLNKAPSPIEVYNDLDGELVNLFETIRDNPDAFLKRAEFLLYSRELFERWQTEVTGEITPVQDSVERALRFWYVLRCSFGAQAGKGWAFTRAEARNGPLVLYNSLLNILAIHDRVKSVEIDHLDFRRCIENRDAETTFMFLDPPYLDTEQYRVGKFTLDDHKALATLLQGVKGKWLMTIGDHAEIRRLYADRIRGKLESTLSVEKVLKEDGTGRRKLTHLIISNYPLPEHAELPRPETSAAAIHREEGD